MATKKLGSVKNIDTVLVTSVNLAADVGATILPVANGGTGNGSFTDGQLLIGNTTGNTLTKAALTGTANQVIVTNGGGSITLSTPQSIASTSSPTFGGLTLTAALPIASGGTSQTTGYAALDALTLKGSDIASASTTNLASATGAYVNVTGTATITALGTAAAGVERLVQFTGALTLTHNATSLILPGAASIVTVAGDTARFVSLGSGNWLCASYNRGAAVPWAGQMVLLSKATASSSASVSFNFNNWTSSNYAGYLIKFDNVAPATNAVFLLTRTSANGTTFDSGSSDYNFQTLQGSTLVTNPATTQIIIAGASTTLGNASFRSTSGEIYLAAPNDSSTFFKTYYFTSEMCSDGQMRVSSGAGSRLSAAAIQGVTFLFSSGNIASGVFRLYGLIA